MEIRRIDINEGEAFFNCLKSIDQETKFMMFEADERQYDEKQMHKHLANSDDLFLGVFKNNIIIGFLSAERGQFRRIRHSAYIVIGIRKAFQNQGIGSKLFLALDDWAKHNQLQRLELTVEVSNPKAINLYNKHGFKIEGTKRNSMLVDGQWIDEYLMAKLF